MEHFVKDMRIAEQNARGLGLETPGVAVAQGIFERLADEGYAREGTQAL